MAAMRAAQRLEVERGRHVGEAHALASALISDRAPPVAIIAFDGMQSHRWAAPPTMSRSTSVTSAPSRAAWVAAWLPAGPPPMITNRFAMPPRLPVAIRPLGTTTGRAESDRHHVGRMPASCATMSAVSAHTTTTTRPTVWIRSIGVRDCCSSCSRSRSSWSANRAISSRDTIWAEDGRIFTDDALFHQPVGTLLRVYAGYTQFTTRVLALGTRPLAPRSYAPYLAVSAAVVVALLGLIVVRSARSWVASPCCAGRWASWW